jgi:hypothetical protein
MITADLGPLDSGGLSTIVGAALIALTLPALVRYTSAGRPPVGIPNRE